MEALVTLLKIPVDRHRGGNEVARKLVGGEGSGELRSPISCTPSSPKGIFKENFTPRYAVIIFPNKDANSCPWHSRPQSHNDSTADQKIVGSGNEDVVQGCHAITLVIWLCACVLCWPEPRGRCTLSKEMNAS